eukprot:gene7135-biopygen6024
MPAPRPRHPKPTIAYPRHARASVMFPLHFSNRSISKPGVEGEDEEEAGREGETAAARGRRAPVRAGRAPSRFSQGAAPQAPLQGREQVWYGGRVLQSTSCRHSPPQTAATNAPQATETCKEMRAAGAKKRTIQHAAGAGKLQQRAAGAVSHGFGHRGRVIHRWQIGTPWMSAGAGETVGPVPCSCSSCCALRASAAARRTAPRIVPVVVERPLAHAWWATAWMERVVRELDQVAATSPTVTASVTLQYVMFAYAAQGSSRSSTDSAMPFCSTSVRTYGPGSVTPTSVWLSDKRRSWSSAENAAAYLASWATVARHWSSFVSQKDASE